MQFVAPSICLLSGQGLAVVLAWVRSHTLRRRLLLAGMLGLVAMRDCAPGRQFTLTVPNAL